MMTIAKILDAVLPYTPEELRCGLQKQVKVLQRDKLRTLIQQWYDEKTKTKTNTATVEPSAGSRGEPSPGKDRESAQ